MRGGVAAASPSLFLSGRTETRFSDARTNSRRRQPAGSDQRLPVGSFVLGADANEGRKASHGQDRRADNQQCAGARIREKKNSAKGNERECSVFRPALLSR